MTDVSNVGFFDESLYTSLDEKAKMYFMEDAQLEWIPTLNQTPLHADYYKKPNYGRSVGVTGTTKLGAPTGKMSTPKNTRNFKLEYVDAILSYDLNDLKEESKYLPQRKASELQAFEDAVKQAVFKGVYKGSPGEGMFSAAGLGIGQLLTNGIIEQSTLVENINGTDSLLNAAGDVMKALDSMLAKIPFRLRDGRKVTFGIDDLFARRARNLLFRGGDSSNPSELDVWFREHSDEVYLLRGQEVANPKPMISDKLFLNQVAGTVMTEVDVKGTHSRIFAAVVDPDVLGQAYSFRGMVGEQANPLVQGIDQRYAAKVKGCVFETEAVCFSEQITWA